MDYVVHYIGQDRAAYERAFKDRDGAVVFARSLGSALLHVYQRELVDSGENFSVWRQSPFLLH